MTPLFREHEGVVLVRDLPEEGLTAGARGAIVWVYEGGRTYEVEFFTAAGGTISVVTCDAGDLRPRQ